MTDGVDMPPPARGCLSTEGTGRGSTESVMNLSHYIFTKFRNAADDEAYNGSEDESAQCGRHDLHWSCPHSKAALKAEKLLRLSAALPFLLCR